MYYSAHDTTCGLFLSAFQVLKDWPPYASHIVMELYSDPQNNWYVKFMYNDQVMHLPGCSTSSDLCDYQTFSDLAYKSVMTPQNWTAECASVGPVTGQGWVGMYLC